MARRPETYASNDDRRPRNLDRETQKKNSASPSSPPNERRQAGDLQVDTGGSNSTSTSSHALTGLESPFRGRTRSVGADGEKSSGNGGTAVDKLLNTYPSIAERSLTRLESATSRPQQNRIVPNRHPLYTLRKKGFGSDCGDRSGGAVAGEMSTADEAKKLRTSLKRLQEEAARERERREMCEEQARLAYVSLEAESKR